MLGRRKGYAFREAVLSPLAAHDERDARPTREKAAQPAAAASVEALGSPLPWRDSAKAKGKAGALWLQRKIWSLSAQNLVYSTKNAYNKRKCEPGILIWLAWMWV